MGFKDFEVSGLCNDGVDYIDCEISEVRSCVENDDNELLSKLVQMFQNMVEEFQRSSVDLECGKYGYKVTSCSMKSNAALSNHDHIQTGRSLISIFRALKFLWKVSSRCVQEEWDFFVANTLTCRPSAWFTSLEQAFLIFPRIFVAVLGSDFIPLEEKKELRRGCQTVLLAATAALKLALTCQKCSQIRESFEIINTLISGGLVQGQELKWLISCTYNIGVRMFNNKQFDLACNPLKLAYTAAWRRISFVLNGSLDDCVESECGTRSSESISELVSDACGKSVVLVDVLHRGGSPVTREIITDFLTQWSSADSRLSNLNSRRALVKHWVKIVSADCKDMDMDEVSVEDLTLYKLLTDNSSVWPVETLGILLEEELLAYANIETELSRLIQKRIIKLLLEDVYVTKEFSLERSRVLLEQCKAARLIGSDGLDKCIDCLSEAIFLLREDLDQNFRPSGKSYHMDCVRHQLAITYCVHAFCIQELNSDSQVILDDISSAMKLWSCIYSSELLDLNKEQKDWLFDTSVPLLLNMSQLLALKGQKSTESAFVTSTMFYILSEKCRTNGKLSEALKYSKEALLIRRKQLQRSFKFLEKKVVQFACNSGDEQKSYLNVMERFSLEARGSVATNVWPNFSYNRKQQECGMSQWIVLGNYLESLMQVGVVYEMVGAADEAEYVFDVGLNISNAQDLPLVQAAFGSCLGEIYRKRHKWEIAEKRFQDAMNVFCRPDVKHVCKLCKVTIEAMLEMRIGDFVRRCPRERKSVNFYRDLTSALDIYMSAKEKLHDIGRKYSDDMPLHIKMHTKCCDRNSQASKEGNVESSPKLGYSSRISKSKIFSFGVDTVLLEDDFCQDVNELCKGIRKPLFGEPLAYASNGMKENRGASQKEKLSSTNVHLNESSLGVKAYHKGSECACRRTEYYLKSRRCKETQKSQLASFDASSNGSRETLHQNECDPSVSIINKTESIRELITFTLECHMRSLMSRLLLQIGKCHETSREFHKAYEIILQNISLQFFHINGLPCLCSFVNDHHCQQKCPGWRIPVDILLIERAALLYHISWFSLKKNLPALSWTQCCSSSENLRSFVIGWLHHAFFICSQMPALLQKVSILLAIVHMPLAVGGLFSVPEDYTSNLSGSHWSAYFHQASLGTTLREEHVAVLDAKLASRDSDTNEVFCHNNSRDVIERVQQVLRLIPDKLDCLESFVSNFFRSVPLPTIVCISLLDCRYASILEESSFSNSSSAWIFLTRFDSNGPPVVLLLPIHSTFNGTRKDAVEGSNPCSLYSIRNLEADDLEGNDIGSISEVMDVVAEEFRLLLEESRLSTSDAIPVASNEDKNRWWKWRMQLDNRLGNLLRGIEDSWLGPWKCLLLGKPSEAAYYDALQTHMQDLKSMVDSAALNIRKEDYFPVDTGLLKTLLGGVPSLTNNEIEKCICCLLWWKYFKLLQSPSLAQVTSLECSMEWNGKETMHGLILSQCIHEGSACKDIIGKTAKELTSIFQRAASRKNNYSNIHNNEPRKSSRKQKKQIREEDSRECRSSESLPPSNLSNDLENLSTTCIPREPVVLVLDANSQVLPWESLPILRNQEVYRMPSVGSISAVMISRGHLEMVDFFDEKEKKMSKRKTNTKQEIVARKNPWSVALEQPPKLPVMDPYNAFYLLSPSGDVSPTQAAFEDWFKCQQGWKGKSREIPTPEECIFALQKHDLFFYLGHGSGKQYIPERNIRRLDYCAAVVLMGCSSGRLSYRGDYGPVGVPLSYLIAGCPCIIANLWDVTDADICRFSRVLLHSWLEAKSSHCSDLDVLEEFQNLTISGQNSDKKVLRPKQKLKDDKTKCLHEVRTGSCIGKGRIACKLPYLIGASPVCYGIPTTVKHKY